jgi:hypothetical protein
MEGGDGDNIRRIDAILQPRDRGPRLPKEGPDLPGVITSTGS